jgi:Tfp pilus assembly protein FimT
LLLNRNKKNANSFSFIELIVVLVIAATLVAIVAPRMSGVIGSVKLNSTAIHLRTFINFVRSNAILKRKICRIHYYSEERIFKSYIHYEGIITDSLRSFREIKDLHGSYVLPDGIYLLEIKERDGLKIRQDSDFNFDILPMGSEYEISMQIGDKSDYKINIIIRQGSGIVTIEKVDER